jgi:predicted alpha-1,2-mannosidase
VTFARAWSVVALLALLTLPLGAATAQPGQDLATYVDPFIGTGPAPTASYGQEFDGGDVFPGAAYPSGMLSWSPDTIEHRLPGGYFYPDRTLKGFSLTHFSGRGCTVYQDVPILPLSGPLDRSPRADPSVMRATFSHANESASPGQYGVRLDNDIAVELAVTARTGLGRVTFPAGSGGTLVIDAGGSVNDTFDSGVTIDPDRQLVTGWLQSEVGCGRDRYTLFFAIAFDRPLASYGTWAEETLQPGAVAARSAHSGAYLTFDTSDVQQVRLKPAISYVSIDNALTNLETENAGWDPEAVAAAARAAWNAALGRIEVRGGSERSLRTFYTALYHTFFHPNVFSDVNGQYIGFDDQVHQAPAGHAHYHNIPGWDQYRSLIQLRAMLAPDETSDIIQSMVYDAQQGGGGMPRWEQANRNSAGMVGDSPGPYIASAFAFGARGFDAAAALRALDYGATVAGAQSGGHAVREWLEPWLALGYIADQPSITLEYAADDFAIGQFARALGDDAKADLYLRRAGHWANTFNPATGYVESRNSAGVFPNADHSHACCGFVEGNAAQYTWMVPFDYPGLIARLGGPDVAIARLDDFFSELNAGQNRPRMWIGNEPNLGTPWAFTFAGAAAKTQSVVRQIQLQTFDTTPGGLPGNDDGGTTSAWYVFSALGFYPLTPGVGGVALGSPLFEEAVVHLANGRDLRIVGVGAAEDAPYVQRLTLDGAAVAGSWLEWSRVADGATLEFTLGATPSSAAGQTGGPDHRVDLHVPGALEQGDGPVGQVDHAQFPDQALDAVGT